MQYGARDMMYHRSSYFAEVLEPRRLLAAVAWDGGGDGLSWGDARNWDTETVPAADDDVFIDADVTVGITAARSVRSLVSLAPLEIFFGSLEVRADSQVTALTLVVQAALTGDGDLRVDQSLDMGTGQITGAGDLIIGPSATAVFSEGTDGERNLKITRDISNQGLTRIDDANLLFDDDDGDQRSFVNDVGGTVILSGSVRFLGGGQQTATFTIDNRGEWVAAGSVAALGQDDDLRNRFNHSGQIRVESGDFETAPGVMEGGVNVAAGAVYRTPERDTTYETGFALSGGGQVIVGGRMRLPTGFAFGPSLSVSLSGLRSIGPSDTGGRVSIEGRLNWSGGGLFNVDLGPDSDTNVSGTVLINGIVRNLGEMSTGGSQIEISSGSVGPARLVNAASGRIIIDGALTVVENPSDDAAAPAVVANDGLIEKIGPDEARLESVRLENAGVIDVRGGLLTLPEDAGLDGGDRPPSSGRFVVRSGADLATAGPVDTLAADITLHGSGTAPFLTTLAANAGRIALRDGAILAIAPPDKRPLLNRGRLDISAGSRLDVVGDVTFAGGERPAVRVELASPAAFGRLDVVGRLTLSGPGSAASLDADLVGGFDPDVGDVFPVLTASAGIADALDAFGGGLDPSGDVLAVGRPDANTLAVEIVPGPLPSAPQILGQSFDFTTRLAVIFTFDQDVSAFLGRSDYEIVNTDTGDVLPQSAGVLTFNRFSNQAVLDLTGDIPDGNYTLTVEASDIANAAGVPASGSPITLDFFVLAGDFNRDRSVNLSDFTVLANNFGQGGRLFSQGDANYDGVVNLSDFTILANRFGTFLPDPDDDGGLFD